MAQVLSYTAMAIGGVGIFCGFYFLSAAPGTSIAIVTVTTVGLVGILAFVRHVVFFRSDAERLGWQTDRPDWMFEVGFANLAFGLMGCWAGLATMDLKLCGVVLGGYGLYLFQAAMLHLYRYLTDERRSPARLWRSVIATLAYAGMMAFFAVRALAA